MLEEALRDGVISPDTVSQLSMAARSINEDVASKISRASHRINEDVAGKLTHAADRLSKASANLDSTRSTCSSDAWRGFSATTTAAISTGSPLGWRTA
jgi:hypothetical protein